MHVASYLVSYSLKYYVTIVSYIATTASTVKCTKRLQSSLLIIFVYIPLIVNFEEQHVEAYADELWASLNISTIFCYDRAGVEELL